MSEGSDAAAEAARQTKTPTAPQQLVPWVDEPEDELSADPAQLRTQAERRWGRIRAHVEHPSAPPPAGRRLDSVLWGAAQPLLGLRVLLREPELLARAAVPAGALVLICALVAQTTPGAGLFEWIAAYYATLTGAAALSPIFFTRSYAKLAAEARPHLGLDARSPYLRSYWQAAVESVVQLILLSIGVAPLVAMIAGLPLLGAIWGVLLTAAWALHWIVVEALDSARTLPPDEDMKLLARRHAKLDPPWYSAAALGKLELPLNLLALPVRAWGRLLARLGRRWRGEVALIEHRPWLAVGFGAGAAALLAIPVVNLLFRPAVIVAASHLLGHVEDQLELPELPD